MIMIEGFPRRNRIDLFSDAEQAILQAKKAVEKAGCDPLLTDAIELLSQAQNKVADYVEQDQPIESAIC